MSRFIPVCSVDSRFGRGRCEVAPTGLLRPQAAVVEWTQVVPTGSLVSFARVLAI